MKKTLFTLICLLAFGMTSNAQTSVEIGEINIGVSAGGGVSSAIPFLDFDPVANVHGGVSFAYLASEYFFYEFDLLFQKKGFKRELSMLGYSETETFNAYYMELPLTANPVLPLPSGKVDLGIMAGVYFAYGVGGKVKVEQKADAADFLNALGDSFSEAGMDIEFETDGETGVSTSSERDFFGDDGAKRFDFGIRYGLSLGISERTRFTIAVDHGILDDFRKHDGAESMISKNYVLMGTLSFYFR